MNTAEFLALSMLPAAHASTRKRSQSQVGDLFAFHCKCRGAPPFVREHPFAAGLVFRNGKERRWRFDFAWPLHLVAVEIEGLNVRRVNGRLQVGGRHVSIDGFREDCEKYAEALLLGWRVLRFEQSMVQSGFAIEYTLRALARFQPPPPKETAA